MGRGILVGYQNRDETCIFAALQVLYTHETAFKMLIGFVNVEINFYWVFRPPSCFTPYKNSVRYCICLSDQSSAFRRVLPPPCHFSLENSFIPHSFLSFPSYLIFDGFPIPFSPTSTACSVDF